MINTTTINIINDQDIKNIQKQHRLNNNTQTTMNLARNRNNPNHKVVEIPHINHPNLQQIIKNPHFSNITNTDSHTDQNTLYSYCTQHQSRARSIVTSFNKHMK